MGTLTGFHNPGVRMPGIENRRVPQVELNFFYTNFTQFTSSFAVGLMRLAEDSVMQLRGIPLGGGTGFGRLKAVRGWESISIETGTVLVTRFPTPKLISVLPQVSALICAYGSCDSYLAQRARQYGIPTVFQIGDSIEQFQENEWIHVDGVSGIILREPALN